MSNEVVAQITQIVSDFQTKIMKRQLGLQSAESDYMRLLQTHASLGALKGRLQEIMALRLDLRTQDILTSRKVESLMTPEQTEKWKAIQARLRGGAK